MTRKILLSTVFVLCGFSIISRQSHAQLSSPMKTPTLSEYWAWSKTVLETKWISGHERTEKEPGRTTLEIQKVLKGDKTKFPVGMRITLRRFVYSDPGKKCLMVRDLANSYWEVVRDVSQPTIDYMQKAPSPENSPQVRLAYFVPFLHSKNTNIAYDAAHELSIAGPKHIAAMSLTNLKLLESFITEAERDTQFYSSLNRLIVGYLQATGTEGLDLIDRKILRNPKSDFNSVLSTARALRYFWNEKGKRFSQDRLLQSMRLTLDHGDFRMTAITFLTDWNDWAVQDRLLKIYETTGDSNTGLYIIHYLVKSSRVVPADEKKPPKHILKSKQFLKRLKKNDPERHKLIVESIPRKPVKITKPKAGRVDVAGNLDKVAYALSGIRIYNRAIHNITFSPDSRFLLSGSGDGTVRWWEPKTGRRIDIVQGHKTWCFSIAFSKDGKQLATGSGEPSIKLWTPTNRSSFKTLKFHTDDVHAVAFAPSGDLLFSAGDDKVLFIYDLKKSTVIKRLEGHKEQIPCLAVSPDGSLVATGSRDDTIRIWDTASGKLQHLLKGHSGDVHSVAFSPDGTTLASASYDETVKLWDLSTGKIRRTLREHANWVFSVAYSPDGKRIASGDKDGRVVLWDSTTGKKLGVLKRQRHVSSVKFSPDGKLLASSAPDATICLWNYRTLKLENMLVQNTQQDAEDLRKQAKSK